MKTKWRSFSLAAAMLTALLFASNAPAAPGDLYVIDASVGKIYQVTPAGVATVFAAGLKAPAALAFDRSGNLLVADPGAGAILKFTPGGAKSIFASVANIPAGLAFDGAGNLFVALPDQNRNFDGTILKFAPDGSQSLFAESEPLASLAFDTAGNLFAASIGLASGAILEFSPAGKAHTFAVVSASDLAFGPSGDLFATDLADKPEASILRYTLAGKKSVFVASLPPPSGMAFDDAGNLFVGAGFPVSNTILKFAPDGTQTTFTSGLIHPTALAFEPNLEKLRNISARGLVQTGDNALIGGFIVGATPSPVMASSSAPRPFSGQLRNHQSAQRSHPRAAQQHRRARRL